MATTTAATSTTPVPATTLPSTTTLASSNSSSTSQAASSSATSGTLQTLGIGSGLDISNIVSQLTTAEGAAQNSQLDSRESTLKAQVSAFGTFRAALEALQAALTPLKQASKLQGRSAKLGDDSVASATATGTAIPATYTLKVSSLATAASLVSDPIASSDSTIGTGTLTIAIGGVSAQVTIDSSNNTLAGIAAAINSAPGNPGVNASIINTAAGARLVLNGTKTGAANAITVTQSGGDGGLAQLVYDPANGNTRLTQSQAAADAQFSLNGFAATSASNEVTGVIDGVSFTLLKVTGDNSTTITVGYDQDASNSAVSNFVTAYNSLVTSVQALTSYDATTRTAGTLLGNSTVNTLMSRLRQILGQSNTSSTGSVKSLSDLGITTSVDGTFSQDAGKLAAALSANLTSVTDLLSGTNGLASKLDNILDPYTSGGGLLDTINQGLNKGLSDVSAKRTALQVRLDTYSAMLTKQFNAMDSAVAALKQTQTYITQAFETYTIAQKNG